MTVAIPAFAREFRQQDKRTPCEWGREHVWTPNMARGERFDPDATPWFRKPIDLSADTRVREIVVMAPTGAGKTNFVDAVASYRVSETHGNLLLAVQGNAEAQRYIEKRLMPCFRQIPRIKGMLEMMPRHSSKKGTIGLPGKELYWGGANETNGQATSATLVIVDEAWMAYHGGLESFRARLHNRWNRLFVALGQGGEEQMEIGRGKAWVDTEWEAAWAQTDQQEWCFECPQCGEVQRYRLRGLVYERTGDSSDFDESAIIESTRYHCIGAEKQACDAVFEDKVNVRRLLTKSARYVATKEKFHSFHHGFHINALGIWYEEWGEIALAHARAHRARKRGDEEPIRLFRQKRMAENYRRQTAAPITPLTIGTIGEGEEERPYVFADYAEGQLWAGEALRIMTIDCQLDHFWAWVQAFKADGSARLLYFDKISTEDGLRALQLRMKVKPLELARPVPSWVFIDCGHNQERAFTLGGKYGWWAMRGEGTKGKMAYGHDVRVGKETRKLYRYYSEPIQVAAASGFRCRVFNWLNLPVKRITEKMRGGYREPWEVPADLGEKRTKQLFSEIERDGVFVKLTNENHGWDCANMATVGAIIAGVLPDKPPESESAQSPETPARVN